MELPVRYIFLGDKTKGRMLKGLIDLQILKLKYAMKLGGLQQLRNMLELSDGSTIVCNGMFDQITATIFVPIPGMPTIPPEIVPKLPMYWYAKMDERMNLDDTWTCTEPQAWAYPVSGLVAPNNSYKCPRGTLTPTIAPASVGSENLQNCTPWNRTRTVISDVVTGVAPYGTRDQVIEDEITVDGVTIDTASYERHWVYTASPYQLTWNETGTLLGGLSLEYAVDYLLTPSSFGEPIQRIGFYSGNKSIALYQKMTRTVSYDSASAPLHMAMSTEYFIVHNGVKTSLGTWSYENDWNGTIVEMTTIYDPHGGIFTRKYRSDAVPLGTYSGDYRQIYPSYLCQPYGMLLAVPAVQYALHFKAPHYFNVQADRTFCINASDSTGNMTKEWTPAVTNYKWMVDVKEVSSLIFGDIN